MKLTKLRKRKISFYLKEHGVIVSRKANPNRMLREMVPFLNVGDLIDNQNVMRLVESFVRTNNDKWREFNGKEAKAKHSKQIIKKPKCAQYAKKTSKDFYWSREWRQLRYQVLKEQGAKCCLCGVTPAQGAIMHVDHIKPRSLHPHLELDKSNLQVLCEDCNLGKSNLDDTDFRSNK